MKCIICKTDKSYEELTKEHIFPDSIGGTITLDCICRQCNSTLGSKVDSHLVNHTFVQFERLELGISGKSRQIPNPLKEGYINDNKKIRYIFDDSGNPKELYIFPPDIQINQLGNEAIEIRVDADKKDQTKLASIINKKLNRIGLSELSNEEEEKIRNAQALSGYRPWVNSNIKVDLFSYQRAILKIAYELAYYWLGETYLNDKVGEVLRLCISDNFLEGHWIKKYPLGASIDFVGEDFWVPYWKSDTNHHIALMTQVNRRITCYVRIFKVFQGLVTISIHPHLYPRFANKFLAINAQTKETQESDLDIELLKLAGGHRSVK